MRARAYNRGLKTGRFPTVFVMVTFWIAAAKESPKLPAFCRGLAFNIEPNEIDAF